MPYLLEQFGIYGFGDFQRLQAWYYQELYGHDLAEEKIKKAQDPETMLEALANPDFLFFMLYYKKRAVGYMVVNLAKVIKIEEEYIEAGHRNEKTKALLEGKLKEVAEIWSDRE